MKEPIFTILQMTKKKFFSLANLYSPKKNCQKILNSAQKYLRFMFIFYKSLSEHFQTSLTVTKTPGSQVSILTVQIYLHTEKGQTILFPGLSALIKLFFSGKQVYPFHTRMIRADIITLPNADDLKETRFFYHRF